MRESRESQVFPWRAEPRDSQGATESALESQVTRRLAVPARDVEHSVAAPKIAGAAQKAVMTVQIGVVVDHPQSVRRCSSTTTSRGFDPRERSTSRPGAIRRRSTGSTDYGLAERVKLHTLLSEPVELPHNLPDRSFAAVEDGA